jgi:hypothetical protein
MRIPVNRVQIDRQPGPGIIEVFARYHKAVVIVTITGTCQGATGYPCCDSVVLQCYTSPGIFLSTGSVTG